MDVILTPTLRPLCTNLACPRRPLQDFQAHLNDPSALDQAKLPEHLRRVIRSLHTDTFFQVHGQTDVCHATVGSRPGDCFADVVFSYLLARVIRCFQDHLASTGLQEFVRDAKAFDPYARLDQEPPHQPYLGPVWMDDLCLGMTSPTPGDLLRKVGVTTSILLETLESFGMTPNLKKGKAEV